MGCDIHAFVETYEDGKWVPSKEDQFEKSTWYEPEDDELMTLNTDRNYDLFGLLCNGVRREFVYSFDDKGIPLDCSPEVLAVYTKWGSDAHTPSYLTKSELQKKAAELLVRGEQEMLHELNAFIKMLYGEPETQRVVFWFDN